MTTPVDNDPITKAMALFPIQEFDFDRDERAAMRACSIGVIGSSKSGKTTLIKYLLKKHFADDLKVFMTQSPQADIYNSIKSECAFAPAYIPDILKTCSKINRETKNHYPFLVVIDDVTGVKNDPQMTKLLCLYRNHSISSMVCGQDLTLLSATGRANLNHIVLMAQRTSNRIEDNCKQFLRGYLPRNLSMDERIELYKRLTEDHCFLWIDALEGTIRRCRLKASQIVD
jgi:GTPase SAR1 family protein